MSYLSAHFRTSLSNAFWACPHARLQVAKLSLSQRSHHLIPDLLLLAEYLLDTLFVTSQDPLDFYSNSLTWTAGPD